MAGHRLGRADRHARRMLAEDTFDRVGLSGVVVGSRSAMGIDIIDFEWIDPAAAQRQAYAPRCPFPFWRGSGHVVGISVGPIANHLGIDLGPTTSGLLQFFEY